MELLIQSAGDKNFEDVRAFYHALIEAMENAEYKPGWEKDIYPSPAFHQSSIQNGELYMGAIDGRIVSCMVLNQSHNDGYQGIKWSLEAEDSEIMVIHALGVTPEYAGQGIATQMVDRAIDIAKKHHIRTIRLDVLHGNIPAVKTYTNKGFRYVDTVRMFYEDTGRTEFGLYEYLV